jgi:acetylornithine/N-succinyldiaminopimelate aminotransferase
MLKEFPAYTRLPEKLSSASDNQFQTAEGTTMLDFYGGHCVNTLGAGNPSLGLALSTQWQQCSFTTNLIDMELRKEFLQALEPGLPHGDWQVFCSNSGAEANENLLKMALHATARKTVVAFEGAFHGRTAAAAAVSDSAIPAWPSTPFDVRRLPWGSTDGIDEDVAAVILEPIQSLAGVIMPPAGFLAKLRAACDLSGALLLFDEVQTGNGRLGMHWASQYFGVIPDGFSTAKGCAAGLPMGLSFINESIAGELPGSLCGSTFGGGPLAMRAAIEVQQRLADPQMLGNVRARNHQIQSAIGVGPVLQVHGAGLLLGLEIEAPYDARSLRDQLLNQGILTGLSNHPQILRLSPALTIGESDVQHLLHALANLEVAS